MGPETKADLGPGISGLELDSLLEPGVAVEILLVEDNPADIRLTREALKEGRVRNRLQVATTGEEALELLRSGVLAGDVPRPDLILLDLNLPGLSGHEVLETIKDDPDLRRIPVIVLTTSDSDDDVRKSYSRHANSFITKPVDFDKFIHVVQDIEGYWFTLVRLPSQRG